MSVRSTDGFSVVEVLFAVVVLGVGIIALASTSGIASRQIGRGRMVTYASQLAAERFDALRRAAAIRNSSGQMCQHSSFVGGSATAKYTVTETWTISAASVGQPRTVIDSVSYPRTRGRSWLKLSTIIGCK